MTQGHDKTSAVPAPGMHKTNIFIRTQSSLVPRPALPSLRAFNIFMA